jgi:hypothetical protein
VFGGDTTTMSGDMHLQYLHQKEPNQAPFGKISKSGDGGGSGCCFANLDNLTIIWLRLTKEVLYLDCGNDYVPSLKIDILYSHNMPIHQVFFSHLVLLAL